MYSGVAAERYQEYLRALLAGRRNECLGYVRALLAEGVAVKTIYERLFRPALYDVGRLWETNRISVAVEHLATSITEFLMTTLYPQIFAGPRIGRSVVVSCVPDELHQVGAKMAADLFELHGWDGYFLGASTPLPDLVAFVQEKKPDLVGLSVSLYGHLPVLADLLDDLSRGLPAQAFIVGGQAFSWGETTIPEDFPRTTLVRDLDQLETFIEGFR